MKAFLVTTQSFKMAFTVVKSAGEFCGTVSDHSRTLSNQNVGTKVNIEPRLSIGTLEHRLHCEEFSIKLSVFGQLFCVLLASSSYHEVDDRNEKIKKNNNSFNNQNKNSESAAQFLADFFAVNTRISLSNLMGMAIQFLFQFQLDSPISALVTTELHRRQLHGQSMQRNPPRTPAFLPVQQRRLIVCGYYLCNAMVALISNIVVPSTVIDATSISPGTARQ